MRDAIGGAFNMSIIIAFLLIVSGYLAFNINYTKAFRVKNKIITTLEQYEGKCDDLDSDCAKVINNYMESLGYHAPDEIDDCSGISRNGYCIEEVEAYSDGDSGKKVYYKVTTAIIIDVPIINKILPSLNMFQVSGNTKLIDVS